MIADQSNMEGNKTDLLEQIALLTPTFRSNLIRSRIIASKLEYVKRKLLFKLADFILCIIAFSYLYDNMQRYLTLYYV